MSDKPDKPDKGAEIVRVYVASKNKDGAALPGVPLRDLTRAEYDSFPKWIQASIDAWDAYKAK